MIDVLPPLQIMEQWRNEGYSPKQISRMADEWIKRNSLLMSLPRLRKTKDDYLDFVTDLETWDKVSKDKTLGELANKYNVSIGKVYNHWRKLVREDKEKKKAEKIKIRKLTQ